MPLNVAPDTLTTGEAALAQLTRRVQRLYTLPGAALQIVQLASNADVSALQLKEAIETDPALTAKILAVVNSSLFGLRGRIVDLHRAVAVLGIKPLQLLALGLSLPRNLLDVEFDLLSNFWRMSLSKSVAAKEISRRFYAGRLESESFIAALLQDLGMLVLMQQLQGPYTELVIQSQEAQADLLDMENQAMGFDHTAVSSSLLEAWGLPEHIVRATRLPFHVGQAEELTADEQTLTDILTWSDLYGRFMAGQTRLLPQIKQLSAQHWQLEGELLDHFLRELDDHVHALAVAYGIDSRSWPDLTLLVQDAFANLAETAESHVREWLGSPGMLQALAQMSNDSCEPQPAAAAARKGATATPATGNSAVDLELVCATGAKKATHCNTTSSSSPRPLRAPRNADAHRGATNAEVLARIATSAEICRRSRQALSLMLCALDRHDEMLAFGGMQRVQKLVDFIEQAMTQCAAANSGGGISLGDARFALVLENCDRAEALQLARELADRVRSEAPPCALPGGCAVSLSVGVASLAVPPRNFAAEDLLSASQRCLYAASNSGGGMIKSIDLM